MTIFFPSIVTNGLVLCLDAGNQLSYPGTGTTWSDLSRNGNNGTLTNGPVFNSGGSMVFDGVDDYISTNTNSSLTQAGSTQFTAEIWAKKSASNKDLNIGAWNLTDRKGWFLQWYTDSIVYFGITNGGNNYNYITLNYNSNFQNIVGVFDGSQPTDSTKNKIYINGYQKTLTTSTQLSSVPSNLVELTIGKLTNYSSFTTGNISLIKIYNRALTSQEIFSNYLATKGRYKL